MKKNTESEFMTSIQQEGRIDPPVKEDEEEIETPSEPSAEDKREDDPGTEPVDDTKPGADKGEDDPKKEPKVFEAFHKHPRWKAQQDELVELRQFKEKYEPLLNDFVKGKTDTEADSIPKWFSELFGENEGAWKEYRAHNTREREQLRQEIMQEIDSKSQRFSEEQKKLDGKINTEISTMEAEGLKFDRKQLLETAIKYRPTDEEGNISLRGAYDIMLAMKSPTQKPSKQPTEEKKVIADKTMGKDKPDNSQRGYKTSFDLAGKSFRDIGSDE